MDNDMFANPPFYAAGSEVQIIQQLAMPSGLGDFIRSTPWALPTLGGADCYVHWQNPATKLLTLIPSSDSPEARI
jgi:hypothetical protein